MTATTRFCPRCATEVEDVGGFCLLGHRLSVEQEQPHNSLSELRAEVDRAFEDAKLEVAAALTNTVGSVGVAREDRPPAAVPPPPPPPSTNGATIAAPPENVPFQSPPGPDPIAAFAPPPHMDWGPERHGLIKRRSR